MSGTYPVGQEAGNAATPSKSLLATMNDTRAALIQCRINLDQLDDAFDGPRPSQEATPPEGPLAIDALARDLEERATDLSHRLAAYTVRVSG